MSASFWNCSLESLPPRMVGLPSAFLCAKRASNGPITRYCASSTLFHSSSRHTGENKLTNFERNEIEQGDNESVSIAKPTASQSDHAIKVTKTKKKFSELPQFRVLPDGSVAKPLGQWQSGNDTPGEFS